jgi:hypothetical protein
VLFAEPVEHLREIFLEGIGHAIDETAAILNQHTTVMHKTLKGAHGGPFATQRSQAFKVALEEVDREESIRGIVLGTAWGEGAAILGQGSRIDGKDDEEVVFQQCGNNGPAGRFKNNRDVPALKSLLELGGPRVDGDGVVFDGGEFRPFLAGGHQADVVLAVSPV